MKFEFSREYSHDYFLGQIETFRQGSKPVHVQKFFVYEHVKEFFDLFGRKYLQKVLDDISYILEKRWGFGINDKDFFHGHICGKSQTVIRDIEELLSPSNICFLYHTLERLSCTPVTNVLVPEAKNRNILSLPDNEPKVIHPDYKFGEYGMYVVHSSDLGSWEYARFFFSETPKGQYKLRNGIVINLWGVFP
jgi:hypothetical protein